MIMCEIKITANTTNLGIDDQIHFLEFLDNSTSRSIFIDDMFQYPIDQIYILTNIAV